MARKSLQASTTGVARAKQALVRRNLIQKSLEDEGIASWSTINKFFTGKPVARSIFLEICHRLDLEWEEIAEFPTVPDQPESKPIQEEENAPEPLLSSLLQAVQESSTAAREALTPRILERIPRSIVQTKYLPAIDRGVDGGHQRVIPIIGAAGYGKSTILGNIYDELIQSKTSWVGLILCNTLSLSTGFVSFTSYSIVATTFTSPAGVPASYNSAEPSPLHSSMLDTGFGKSLCGTPQSITHIVEQLTAAHGRGVLLIDTLDLVINRDFVPAFGLLLRQLLDKGVTVVFTCRDHEYNDYLEPTRERLAGLAQRIDRYSVPNFTTAEIRAAAETFFHKLEPTNPERGQAFADNILALSADNRSLQEITQNPLLLALLCDLFAKDGNVPADLTVSKLYQRYWNEKIAYSRVDQSRFVPLALEKDKLCLAIAHFLFERSHSRLCESVYRDDLGLEFTAILTAAYNDLLSEGVVEHLPSGKLHFFHQTLLEYAIAYWLTRHSAQPQRDQLLSSLRQPNASYTNTYWLPILRQLLTIIERDEEFETLVQQLNVDDAGVFGAVALAAASRDRADALRQLLPTALNLGEAHQKRLRQALESAPKSLIEDCWGILMRLLQQAEHAPAINTAKMLSTLLSRWWTALGSRLPEALTAIAERCVTPERQAQRGQDDRILLMGWLLQHCFPLLHAQPDLKLLAALRQYYPLLGFTSCSSLIQLHQHASVSDRDRQSLLEQMLEQGMTTDQSLRRKIVSFAADLLPVLISNQSGQWSSWAEVLHGQYCKGWDSALAQAIGRCAAKDRHLLETVLQDWQNSRSDRLRRNLIVINQALDCGADAWFTDFLTQIDIHTLNPDFFDSLIRFLDHSVASFAHEYQERLAQWVLPVVSSDFEPMLFLLDALANGSPTARQKLEQVLSQLPIEKQRHFQAKLLRFQPIAHHPPLNTFDKQAQLFLIKIYQQQAASCSVALGRLLETAQCNSKEVAISASHHLEAVATGRLIFEQLLPLLHSRFPGVRANGLRAILSISNQGLQLTKEHLTTICTSLGKENDQTVARLLCELVTRWVKTYRQVPPQVAEAIGGVPSRLTQRNTFDGGTGRVVIAALKAITQSEDQILDSGQVGMWVRTLLTEIHLIKIPRGEIEMLTLLCAVNRLDKRFLPILVNEDCPVLAQKRWFRNISAVIKALQRIEGSESPRLSDILSCEWCTSEVKSIILDVRGA